MLLRTFSRSKALASSISSRNQSTLSTSNSNALHSEEMEKLFRYTRGRWLYNEREQNEIRYIRFNSEELVRVTCEATGTRSCTLFTKLEEGYALGSYNKAFCLTLDDSSRVIARLPCPLAGPSYEVTASEVATLQFAREVLRLPVPRVITWSGAKRNHLNRVGADYIIMEEVPGVRLGHRWTKLEHASDVRPIMYTLMDVESKFESLRFSRIGSLYFKEDVSAELQAVPLLSGDVDIHTREFSERYRVGPLINPQWWRGERIHMALDRGPWDDASSFFIAAAKNAQLVLAQHSSSSSLYRRKPTHDHAVHSKLLSMYIASVPHFMPPNESDTCAPTLWHPDLSLGNLFVSASGPANLQGIIDWQHAAILPYFSFATVPPALIYDGDKISMEGPLPGPLPSNLEELSTDEQAEYRLQLRLANRHKWYQAKAGLNARRRAASSLPHIEELMMLPTYVTRAWADGIFDLREALVRIRTNWSALASSDTTCPIKLSAEEMMEHEKQLENFRCYEAAVAAVYSALHCEGDGWVPHENYDVVRELIRSLEETWDEVVTGTPFPFKDGEYSYFLS
ncbi:kinase-like domain-containing protein [Hysterangium stoloniferum]|nr:kinase-like domain-containing protein [Hysterangium stoloniferum]